MSHFYRLRSYTYNETDEMMTEIKKEMSNFLTKEEAEIILNRRSVIVDPNPAYLDNKLENVYLEMQKMREEIYNLRTALYQLQHKFEVDEPTL
jgi:hypothetical protein